MVYVEDYIPSRRCQCIIFRTCAILTLITLLYYTYVQTEVLIQSSIPAAKENFLESAVQRIQNAFPLSRVQKERKIVLLWTSYFGTKDWLPSTDQLNCQVRDCIVTSNRSLLNESSAVIIHWRDASTEDLPTCLDSTGKNCPKVVLFNKEAPPHTPLEKLLALEKKIHWTATYRRDSDIYAPYGKIVKRVEKHNMPDVKRKRSLLCWLVSNCKTPSQRESYVMKLKEYIPVDIYGKCGDRVCPEDSREFCYKWLAERCNFYLSFENSICKDYATEKFYLALSTDMVPVVLGGANYSQHFPHRSYINAADFPSPKSLAEYLVKLSHDLEAYASYFEWKKKYMVEDAAYKWLCQLCEKLHDDKTKIIKPRENIASWWFNDARCASWNFLFGHPEDDELDLFAQYS